jgi:hypothetical protein
MLSRQRPAVRFIVLDGSYSPATVEASEEFTSDDVDLPTQLLEISKAVGSRLKSLQADRAVIRRADFSRQTGNQEGRRIRLLAEGAATSAARAEVIDTHIGTGKDIGGWHGTGKAEVDAAAETLLTSAREDEKFVEAAAAALAGLALP